MKYDWIVIVALILGTIISWGNLTSIPMIVCYSYGIGLLVRGGIDRIPTKDEDE